jgi:rod shape-determining protein MreC
MLELFKKYRTTLLTVCIVMVALLVYSTNLRHREKTTLFERAVLLLSSPMQSAVDFAWRGVRGHSERYLVLVDTEQENGRLREENRWLKAELEESAEVRLANERLRRLLEFKETIDLPVLPAQVIAMDAASWFRTVVIDKGTEHGLREGLAVVVAEGVVGRTVRCGPRQSRVLLVTDASSAVASLVQKNRARGISRGRGEDLNLEFVLHQEEIEAGDLIVTSGSGGIFPKGLTIGRVMQVTRAEHSLFQEVTVTPSVDFSRLEEVLVLLREEE